MLLARGRIYIIFILKKPNNTKVKEFRPITFYNVIIKILSKVLTNRIKPIFNYLINHSQLAFVSSRNIYNNILISNELTHTLSKS